jgi:hypothetical protein
MTFRLLGVLGAAGFVMAVATGVDAQTGPPISPGLAVQSQNPVCGRLEAQLASLDRGGDPRAEQTRRYEEALQGQQAELDRTVAQARRTGCEGSGFFLFGRSQPPQCDELNNRIQRMRANLDRLNTDLQQLQSGRGAVEGQRRQILMALGQNDCGPQYRAAAAPPRQRGFFETLFGGGGGGGSAPFGSGDLTPSDQTSTFRTICVRTCDGFYFPVSYSAGQARFRDDEVTCQRMCPAAEVMLFSYRNPGEDVNQAVSTTGQLYTSLPNAFKYRQEFNPSCSCKRPGESWADALKNLDDTTVERGDIIVTEETAKQLSQPKSDAAKGAKQSRSTNPKAQPAPPQVVSPTAATPPEPASATPVPVTSAPLPDAAQPVPEAPPAPAPEQGKKSIRTVGPPFIAR